MQSPLDKLTPEQISRKARVVAVITALALGLGYVSDFLTPVSSGIGAFLLTCSILLAAPRQRATELLGAVAVWLCFAEFLSTIDSGEFQIWRLSVAVATLGVAMAVLRVQHLRTLMRTSPGTVVADLDRRTVGGIGVLPRSDAQLAELRGEEATSY
ncbi:MAG: hypothetical protein B7Y31_09740 [Novosphingobium sp. 16-62-11]|uniref:hypothetical protein n=1 Tax=Novosphingobium sp. 17-62-19 TaxID=1970406 RepID=UPI000BC7BFC2|nr:hypothetical protein [Novosphingobium sp. 17-62-19]OYX95193.1 MAG: hypothetical protein B7Y74_04955 [Novosphingobium sp. 35-62-5]OYZ37064.1 MAG: hypothetical protein B7Y31_09740 [Novosphingobium sp. 16-62-11]OZA69482.1 MAG: hypothetical protein B7X78_03260 [Sphingomonadales bacterium 39-62-4]HQS95671.1 hypothetical protein [Novosphingobium sp.]OZA21300.1 MAG: hypothetical protein B7X90_02265 [Novosphingobium sp. 17-62-19]